MRNRPRVQQRKPDFNRYLTYMHEQVRELCSNYGKIDILWFDFSYGNLRGEAWKATELMKMVRSLQPDVIIDNRLECSGEGFGSCMSAIPLRTTATLSVRSRSFRRRVSGTCRAIPLPGKACFTMNNHWGYCGTDVEFKPAPMLIKKLVECVSKGGNMLLNVGPDARGNIPQESLHILAEIGRWMKKNSASVYGCGMAGMDKPDSWPHYPERQSAVLSCV